MIDTKKIRNSLNEVATQIRERFAFAFLVIDRDKDIAGTMLGGAVAFRLFLFMVPVVLTLVGLLGFVSDSVTIEDAAKVTGIGGALRNQVESALDQSHSTRWVALIVGLWGTLGTGRALAKTLVAVSAFAWRVPIRRKATFKALIAITGVLVAVFATVGLIGRLRAEAGVAVATAGFGFVAVVYAVGWFIVSLLLPKATNRPIALLPGTVLMAAGTTVIQWLSQIWLPDRFAKASALYGAIGTTAVTLGFFFIIGRLFVWSMVANATIWERYGTLTTVVFSLRGLRWIPARFPRFGHYFGLIPTDEPDVDRPDVDQSGVDQSGVDQSGVDQSGVDQSGVDQSGVDQPDVDRLGVDHFGVDLRNVDRPAVDQLEANRPDGDLLDSDQNRENQTAT